MGNDQLFTKPQLVNAQQALRVSQDSFRMLVEAVRDYAIFLLDPNGIVSTWNVGAHRIKGYAAHEIIGKHFSTFYTQEDLATEKPRRELEIAVREGRYEEEGWRVRKDGTLFWANVVITALFDENHILRGFGKVTRDLTERRKAEEALRDHAAALERGVAERTKELEAANAQLDDARRKAEANSHAKDQFLMMLGHELRGPLGPIRNALYLRRLKPDDPETKQVTQEVLERQVHHLAHLVDDMLDVSRIIRGKIVLRHETVDLSGAVRDAVSDRRGHFSDTGVQISLRLPSKPLWINGDRTRLTQVIGNILENAIKFTDAGGKVEVELQPASQSQAILSIADSGVGIHPTFLPQIFEAFIQADHSLDRTGGGLGLGLAVVKGLVEMHGGTVEAQSAGVGHGSKFVIRLPLVAAPSVPDELPAGAVETDHSMRVLVIEDNRDSADMLRRLLKSNGYEATVAYSGVQGIEEARKTRPQVVLCDIGLPEMDGYAVARALRSESAMAECVMVAITGYGQEEDRKRAAESGFHHHLTKPVDPRGLLKLLRSIHSSEHARLAGTI